MTRFGRTLAAPQYRGFFSSVMRLPITTSLTTKGPFDTQCSGRVQSSPQRSIVARCSGCMKLSASRNRRYGVGEFSAMRTVSGSGASTPRLDTGAWPVATAMAPTMGASACAYSVPVFGST